ncbi:type II toxin-antitoxin system antitoxin SocA domain-containing protein [Radiobacillus sp. PE A8.2]|uniref:type II toxin-antitoxin system antitoxin SocA domain-containing protein n=1 Tax=Radiobacillus sp. PE A8.2 TaxID=3380349 RepID=UPI00388F42B4
MLPFCEVCRDEVEFVKKDIEKTKVIKGREIKYMGVEAFCKECGSPIYEPHIHDLNLKQIDAVYREINNLSTISEVEMAVDMYRMGKRPFSLALGWGEGTITRYLNGDTPTKQYSQILKRVLKDPLFMNELLENNKEKVSDIAYKNCKEAVRRLEEDSHAIGKDKIDSIVQYLLFRSEEITPLALQKLLYFSQGFNKIINGQFLFNDNCEAWVHGPVYREVYNRYKSFGFNPIEEEFRQYNFNDLHDFEKELLDNIVKNFGCYSGKVLEKMTHIETPWRDTRRELNDDEHSNRVISKEIIEIYFSEIKNKYKILNVSDIKDYSKDLFDKIHS